VAGGSGSRMGGDLPKQFLLINGLPVLMHTINRFANYDPAMEIVLVLPESQIVYWKDLCEKNHFLVPHLVVRGGDTRFHSVNNGINAVLECDLIAIHDGVRPLVSRDTIERCFVSAAESGTAIPVLPVNESLRKGKINHSVSVDRSQYFQVQTPQVFNYNLIKNAYHQLWIPEFTDDASVVEKAGSIIQMVLGNRENIKITHPEDLLIAEALLKNI
jgi:2-C-methyl-D-erythritol 4-phosphate cytidylyltransferase